MCAHEAERANSHRYIWLRLRGVLKQQGYWWSWGAMCGHGGLVEPDRYSVLLLVGTWKQ
jgi:hypothetical protein